MLLSRFAPVASASRPLGSDQLLDLRIEMVELTQAPLTDLVVRGGRSHVVDALLPRCRVVELGGGFALGRHPGSAKNPGSVVEDLAGSRSAFVAGAGDTLE